MASLFVCWVNVGSGASVGYTTTALPALQHPNSKLFITGSEGSLVAALLMLGAFIGGMLAGPLISLGRKRALCLVSLPLSLAWLLIGFAQNIWYLYVSHFILGACLGIVADASQLYVIEAVSSQWRGALGYIPVLMFNVGALICYIAGSWLGWEELAFFGCLLTCPALLMPLIFPESPSYLVEQEKVKEAISALRWLRGPNYDITAEYQVRRSFNCTIKVCKNK